MAKTKLPRGAQILRALRAAAGLSTTEMAAKLGLRERSYQRLEDGTTRLLAETLWEARAVALSAMGHPGGGSTAHLDRCIAEGRML